MLVIIFKYFSITITCVKRQDISSIRCKMKFLKNHYFSMKKGGEILTFRTLFRQSK